MEKEDWGQENKQNNKIELIIIMKKVEKLKLIIKNVYLIKTVNSILINILIFYKIAHL